MTPIERAARDRARAAVRRAVERGSLIRPSHCPKCGSSERFRKDGRSLMHAHHHQGYDRPLDVEWLCIDCHFQEDQRPAKSANGRAKITWQVVREIRRRYTPGVNRHHCSNSARSLGREFGIHSSTVVRILRNELWVDAALEEG